MQMMQVLKRLIILLPITRLSIRFPLPRMIKSQEQHVLTGTMPAQMQPRQKLHTRMLSHLLQESIFSSTQDRVPMEISFMPRLLIPKVMSLLRVTM